VIAKEFVFWLIQQFSATKITAMASCGPFWLLLLSKPEITATSTVLCVVFLFLPPNLLMWMFSSVLLSHLSEFRLLQSVSLQAALTTMLPSLSTTCSNPIGWNHTAETAHTLLCINFILGQQAFFWILEPWGWDQ
jgi:hypothetical protein